MQFAAISVFALALFLPFRAIQYDTNGIDEAVWIESGQLFHKNHMLYRPLAYGLYGAAKAFGYVGNSLTVLQIMNAFCGAIGIGLAYITYQHFINDKIAALTGATWLATSFTFWYFSTDAGYIMLAGLFTLAAMACAVSEQYFGTSLFCVLGVLTWQANVFAMPVISALVRPFERASRQGIDAVALGPLRVKVAVATILSLGVVYLFSAFSQGYFAPLAILGWTFSYGAGGSHLPLWGTWAWDRIPSALLSGLRSTMPVLLAAWPSDFSRHVQLGRIAVDISVFALATLVLLAAWKANRTALFFLAGYAIFLPFIVWWDPYDPKWFLIPNIFLGGFIASGLAPWLQQRYPRMLVLGAVFTIGATNFATTILPRHLRLGPDRSMAQCVAENMTAADLFVSAEWGWSEYLPYLHGRPSVSFINDGIPLVEERVLTTQGAGGAVYMLDPQAYSQAHMEWLKAQTGVSVDDLKRFGGTAAFSCYGTSLLRIGF